MYGNKSNNSRNYENIDKNSNKNSNNDNNNIIFKIFLTWCKIGNGEM